ncbi:EAL domain-containing protein [Neptuniibacter halophilus]|uniref:EAL domain-containing protein n=1 Tax=Neptuniibacter halophilus TaxID=651666 RepID=UPI0025726356|nr:EAL domain-containing protein [Neptuniibacter halophilus]
MSKSFNLSQRLALRLAKYTVVIAFAIGVVLSSVQVLEDFYDQDDQLDQTIEKILNASKPPATRAVHTLDQALAQEVVSGLMQYAFIKQARIADELGETLAETAVETQPTQTRWLTQLFSAEEKQYLLDLKAPEYANIEPGQLLVVVDQDLALQSFYARAQAILLSGVVRNILLAVFLLAIFNYVLTRPLARLAQQFSDLDPTKDRVSRLTVPESHRHSELGQLCDSGNQFVTTVQQLLQTNLDSRRALESSENRLTQLINQVPQLIMALNQEGELIFCNQKFEEFYSTDADQLCGRSLFQFHSHLDEVYELDSIRRSVEVNQLETEITDFRWTQPESKTLHFSLQAVPFEYFSEPVILFVATDISEQKMVQAHISHIANHDSLTGLPNRALLNDRLTQALSGSKRTGECGALLFIDLDHFKTINDSLGHGIGDLLLKRVAEMLQAEVRETDTVARLGGDEFVILLQRFEKKLQNVTRDVETVCEKLLKALSEPIQIKQHQLRIGASIGVVLFPMVEKGVDDLMRFADTAMYHAKENGRNCFAFYHQAMSRAVEEQRSMENQLHQALQRQEFCVHYQPLIDSQHQICGFEALIRWQHPERGIVSPSEFIPSLEVSGKIIEVSNWLLGECGHQIQRWKTSGYWQPHWHVAVNICPLQFYQSDMISTLERVITESGAGLEDFCLEITESVAVENIEFAISRLEMIRELGISIALDDFGTGYSSLSYLKDLPIDIVKIDRSFISELGTQSKSQSIIEAVTQIARAYELTVVAEGIESRKQLELAHQVGCHVFQGFYIERPKPADQLKPVYLSGAD